MTCPICGEDNELEQCKTCGRTACPVCLHEADCCFAEADDHSHDTDWAPHGWKILERVEHGGVTYGRE